ncbi:peptidyl-prolyl cis-trans isomerase B (cyclophilin B) [Halopolyspora algeriensis]|uniref:Peptidyl-prolyl cis-trans isomerase n=1 Tax=Halopolyspora algeriensis TaxID=1500506 RepID=A0A368VSF8_9ACTN|nr:peptidylprolyl isomerase [Halopolyspora algeriensis]RCW43902.1 peptidyl-prolyl cis-trans isomerase B (cyclophilin B) [Halopolyspora algeriensis]TQM53595.1 peptidyl-prolyl cis-trans isomerase B (cyclophilin B) [Halopolyspora algeriensis]
MSSNEQRRQAAKSKLERQLARRAERVKRRRTIAVSTTIAVVIAAVVGAFYVTRGGGDGQQAAAQQQKQADITIPSTMAPSPSRPTPLADPVSCEYRPGGEPAKPVQPPADGEVSSTGTVQATIETNLGNIPITLDRSLAPCTVNSFIHLAEQSFYDDTSCHRLSTEGLQMLQCGDPTGKGTGGPGYEFDDETFSQLKYGRGYLAMANSGPDTNGSQFFMVYGTAKLPPKYTVFGTISQEGLKVVDEVARAGHDGAFKRAGGGHPNKKITFKQVTVRT